MFSITYTMKKAFSFEHLMTFVYFVSPKETPTKWRCPGSHKTLIWPWVETREWSWQGDLPHNNFPQNPENFQPSIFADNNRFHHFFLLPNYFFLSFLIFDTMVSSISKHAVFLPVSFFLLKLACMHRGLFAFQCLARLCYRICFTG